MSDTNLAFGRYRVLSQVGRGGMGVIYKGFDPVLDREVAIKVMSADFLAEGGDDARPRFFREAKAAARLQHRNIVTIFEFSEQDGTPYIVMEFLKGRSLSARMSASPPLTLEQKLDVMTELCNGLEFAHANGVIHRDVKPGNIWLLDDAAVKLVDFGIAKITSSMSTMRGDVMGSAAYMSPEVIEGLPVTGRSDVFASAVVLYELVAGRRPFEGESPTITMMKIVQETPPPIETIVPDVPPQLAQAIAKGLQKNPDDRFQTAGEFGDELQLIKMTLPHPIDVAIPDPHADKTIQELPSVRFGETKLRDQPVDREGWSLGALARHRFVWAAAGLLVAAIVAISFWPGEPPAPSPAPPNQAGGGQNTGGRGPGEAQSQIPPPDAQKPEPRVEAKPAETKVVPPVEPTLVRVTVTGSYPFSLHEGQRTFPAATEHDLTNQPAGRRIIARASEVFLEFPFEVRAGSRTMNVAVPELGSLTFTGREDCTVMLRGHEFDNPPFSISRIAAGAHEFRFKCTKAPQLSPMRVIARPGVEVPVRLQ